eukprot:TRINITY_DN28125_c0_g1_i2.p1 TRINITY_DN28125_c0_g1~~TRINITY_DN28125_c0_g1_i2.p1  ORF type:complete len:114 (-),score=3.47 TRINITY_DN28125_c0_g1_i2:46-387(-)
MSCRGLMPRSSPPLLEYDWLEPPQGVHMPEPHPRGRLSCPQILVQSSPISRQSQHHVEGATTVIGRPIPRTAQVVVHDGMPGRSMSMTTPDGTQIRVQVPETMSAGQVMTIQY